MELSPITKFVGDETSPGGLMVVNYVGARLEKLTLGGREILTKVIRGDGKVGSSHPCSPLLGPDRSNLYGLNQHGEMRNTPTLIKDERTDSITLLHKIREGRYPLGMEVRERFQLSGSVFILTAWHINTGDTEAPVNFCHHFYWAAPNGWERLRVNGEDVTKKVEADELIPIKTLNKVEIPGSRQSILLIAQGFRFANLWVYQDKENGQFDTHYFCLEPVEGDRDTFFGAPDSMIAPRRRRDTQVIISLD